MEVLSGQLIWLPLVGYLIWMGFKSLNTSKRFIFFILFLLLAIIASDVTSSYILKK